MRNLEDLLTNYKFNSKERYTLAIMLETLGEKKAIQYINGGVADYGSLEFFLDCQRYLILELYNKEEIYFTEEDRLTFAILSDTLEYLNDLVYQG